MRNFFPTLVFLAGVAGLLMSGVYAAVAPPASKSVFVLPKISEKNLKTNSDAPRGVSLSTQSSKLLRPKEMVALLAKATSELKEYTVTHIQRERFGNTMGPLIQMKLKYSHGKLYLHILEGPKKGAELLYVPGANDGKVKAHKGSFPDLTVNIGLHNHILLDGQHHSLEFSAFPSIVAKILKAVDTCFELPGASAGYLRDRPTQMGPSHTIELNSPWSETKVAIQKDETLWEFAKRTQADPFVILHSNGFESLGDFPSQGELKVPQCYATRTVIGIDAKTKLLTFLEIYDRDGKLYEAYRWEDLDLRPLTDLDFDPSNPSYGF